MENLRRDTDAGLIAGVASGLARRLELGRWVVRLAFIIASMFGGLGLVIYLGAWLLLPTDDDPTSIAERWLSGSGERNSWGGAALIGLAILILLSTVNAVDGTFVVALGLLVFGVLLYRGTFDDRPTTTAPRSSRTDRGGFENRGDPTTPLDESSLLASHVDVADTISFDADFGPAAESGTSRNDRTVARHRRERSRLGAVTMAVVLLVLGAIGILDTAGTVDVSAVTYLASAVIVVGSGLLVGTFWGRSRLLIIFGLALVGVLQVVSWFDVPLTGGFGDPRFRPTEVAGVQDEYRLIAGDMRVDLSDIADLSSATEGVSVAISLGAGSLRVDVPDDVNVRLDARLLGGEMTTFGATRSGSEIEVIIDDGGEDTALDLDIDVGFGELIITRSGSGS